MSGFYDKFKPSSEDPMPLSDPGMMSPPMPQGAPLPDQQQPYGDPMMDMGMGGGLPPASMYGAPPAAFNEKMAELAIGTGLKIGGKCITSLDELPTLFYFLTDNWRHFQLSNLKSREQRYIEREIADIHMLAYQSRRKRTCKLKQIQLLDTLYLLKSRSDLGRMTEREIWTLQTSQFQNQEIKRPKEDGGSGFFSFLGTGKSGNQ